jgi:hypothetical protein
MMPVSPTGSSSAAVTESGGVRHVSNRRKMWLTVSADDVAAPVAPGVGGLVVFGAHGTSSSRPLGRVQRVLSTMPAT